MQTQWVIYSAEMRQIHKWSINGLELKIEKKTKSHSVKKSEIFCCVMNFEMHFKKRKNLRKRRVYAGFGADSRTRTDGLRITNALLYQLSHISIYSIFHLL